MKPDSIKAVRNQIEGQEAVLRVEEPGKLDEPGQSTRAEGAPAEQLIDTPTGSKVLCCVYLPFGAGTSCGGGWGDVRGQGSTR